MCEFVSWVEGPGKTQGQKQVWFLTDHEVYETSRGQELREWSASKGDEDCRGHGAIRYYYELPPEKGQNRECTDFSSPANFPCTIAQAIVQGAFARLAGEMPRGLLSEPVWARYLAECQTVWARYLAERKPVYARYQAECQTVYARYQAERKPVYARYQAERKPVWARYQAERQTVYARYQAELRDTSNRATAWRAV